MNRRLVQRFAPILPGSIGRRPGKVALAASLLLCGAIGWFFLQHAAPEPAYAWPGGDLSPGWSSTETDETTCVAWGDWDRDGDLDLAVGNAGWGVGRPNRVYENVGGTLSLAWSAAERDQTNSLAWGDWDGDGDLDLAVGNGWHYNDEPNRVYENVGGSLSLAWSSTEMEWTGSVAWGDWDGDGDLDLAVGNRGPARPQPQFDRVYENEGGTLSLAWSSVATDTTASVAWGDWDDDGDLDLAVGNLGQSNLVYRNDSKEIPGVPDSSRLVPAWNSAETDATQSVAWGDWNGDGDLDLAVGNGGVTGDHNRVYENLGSSLSPVWMSAETDETYSVVWGDWDSDGDLDLAVGNEPRFDSQQQKYVDGENRVYENTGGDLVLAWTSDEVEWTTSVAWGDWDRDGDLDLVAGNDSAPNRVYENEGGSLSLDWTSNPADGTTSVAWGDWDGDGDLDLAAGNDGNGTPALSRVYENPGGTLSLGWSATITEHTASVSWADWDGDGDPDLATGNGGHHSEQPNRVYENVGGTLSLAWSSTELYPTTSVAWGDFDGWGEIDLAVGNACDLVDTNCQPVQVYVNLEGYGGERGLYLAWYPPVTGVRSTSVAWGDWDGDGDSDLAVGTEPQWDASQGEYVGGQEMVYENVGGMLSVFPDWTSTITDPTNTVAWGDWDGDGDPDLAVGNFGSPNLVYENLGGNLDSTPAWVSTVTNTTTSLAWGDWDNDSDLDLAVGNLNSPNQVYENSGAGLGLSPVWTSTITDSTTSVAWSDWDGEGDLDLVVGNDGQPNLVYANDGGSLSLAWSSDQLDATTCVAWDDWDGDGDLDLAVGNDGDGMEGLNRVYENSGGILSLGWSATISESTNSVAWGDWDGDGDLDLAMGNTCFYPGCASTRLYENTEGELLQAWSALTTDSTSSVAWGDWDGDGDLDLAADARVYEYDQVQRTLRLDPANGFGWDGGDGGSTVAWGDWDNDGDLDLAVGNRGTPNLVYENAGGFLRSSPAWTSPVTDVTASVAWGDWDNDGDLDLAVGNAGGFNQVYENLSGTLSLAWSSPETDGTTAVAWADWDGDGDLDLTVGNSGGWDLAAHNQVYENEGGSLSLIWTSAEIRETSSLAWADWDGDGDLDLAVGNEPRYVKGYVDGENLVYENHSQDILVSVDSPSWAHIDTPGGATAPFFASATVLEGPILPITYTLFDAEGDPARLVEAFYSLDGGSRWHPAIAASGTITTDLVASPTGTTHTYTWDIYNSDFFGASDSVVFRLDVYQGFDGPGPYQYLFRTARTLPFRVRGSQVRVVDENGEPVPDAIVYHRANNPTGLFEPYQDSKGRPFRTNPAGYLLGYGEIGVGDQLAALVPISHTETYTLYSTSAAPSPTGLDAHPVTALGVQTLTVSAEHPLYLFNLDLSLEWDARNDGTFLEDLDLAVQRASALFYDVTDGQAAIGTVRVYQEREKWLGADVVMYAQNGIRPRASMGGVATDLTPDRVRGITITNAYGPGQVRMGPNWDPFGQSLAELDTEWGRALAHELAHYLLYLPDNYLGVDDNGAPTFVDCKGSFMTNTYDDAYSELLPRHLWDEPARGCDHTIAMSTTGRADWQTVGVFYDAVYSPTATFEGPSCLPLDVTRVVQVPMSGTSMVLPALLFDVRDQDYALLSVPGAHGFLFKTRSTPGLEDDAVIPLGSTVADGDRIKVRGAEVGDRLCIVGPYDDGLAGAYTGCIDSLTNTDRAVKLAPAVGWQPNLVVTAVTSRTLAVTATLAVTESELYLQIFPTYGAPTATGPVTAPWTAMALAQSTGTGPAPAQTFVASITLDAPCFDLLVRVWVPGSDPSDPPREALSRIYLSPPWGPNPDPPGLGPNTRAWGANQRQLGAPVASGDGGVTVWNITNIFSDTGTVSLQTVYNLPGLASWLMPVGQGYRFVAGEHFPRAIAFDYLQRNVPAGFEKALYVYYSPDDGATWRRLPTTLDTTHNQAAAPMPDDPDTGYGQGLYALLSTIDLPPFRPGWNLFGYPLLDSRLVPGAFASVEGYYTTVYGHYVEDVGDPWKMYDVTVAPPFQTLVNDLHELSFGHGYWITVSQAVTLSLAPPSESVAGIEIDTTSVPRPPATYYGQVLAGDDWVPAAGMTVQAWIGEHICGEARTVVLADGRIAYAVQVVADDGGATAGCGAAGRPVRFTVDRQSMAGSVPWRDHQAWRLDLAPGANRAYLPVIYK
ncbi:MAG: VCBS repeat-containing protein [Anaerolineae bacterium]|nr:VCBS repeat-containing protein [Anaerolineae bacterium]